MFTRHLRGRFFLHKYSDKYTQYIYATYKHNIVRKYANTQIRKYANTQIYTQIRKYANTQIRKYANTQINFKMRIYIKRIGISNALGQFAFCSMTILAWSRPAPHRVYIPYTYSTIYLWLEHFNFIRSTSFTNILYRNYRYEKNPDKVL